MASENEISLAYVEDNDDTRTSMTYLLESRGYQVIPFASGESASLEIPKLRPKVAVIDIGLPDKDGYELARSIRNHPDGNSIRLIALSGRATQEDFNNTLAAGFDLHLPKPIGIDKLCSEISRVLDGGSTP